MLGGREINASLGNCNKVVVFLSDKNMLELDSGGGFIKSECTKN